MRAHATACAAVVAAIAAGCGSAESDGPPERAQSVPAAEMVERMAPLVHLHSDEENFPLSAADFVRNSRLLWSRSNGNDGVSIAVGSGRKRYDIDPAPELQAARLGGEYPYVHASGPNRFETSDHTRPFDRGRHASLRPRDGYFMDLLTNWTTGERAVAKDGSFAVPNGMPVYHQVEKTNVRGRPATRVTYWMLFGANTLQTAGVQTRHEGDWERVSVLLAAEDSGKRYRPISVRYHQDGRTKDVPWRSATVVSGGPDAPLATHPVVFAGLGDHTPYPRPVDVDKEVRVEGRPTEIALRAKACRYCPRWQTWEKTIDVKSEPWYGFGGGWGVLGESDLTSGPLGPSPHLD